MPKFEAWINWYSDKEFYVHASKEEAIKRGDWKEMRPKARFPVYGEFEIPEEKTPEVAQASQPVPQGEQALP